MIILGLTGSIGMGKSTATRMFRRHGVPVFDADATVHRLQGPGGKGLPAIEAAFPGTTSAEGLNRQKLGALVFGNPEALRALERIIHPMVNDARRNWLAAQARARRPLVVLDVPLLFEGEGWRRCDAIAVVSAPSHIQRRRVLARPGMTAEKFQQILKKQVPDREKRRRADFIIPSGLGLAPANAAVERIIRCLRGQKTRHWPPRQPGWKIRRKIRCKNKQGNQG